MATPPTDPTQVDPLFRELRQRHPEVDIVLLPQQAPAAEPRVPAAGQAQRGALAESLERHLDDLVARLSREPAWTAEQRAGRWITDEWGHVCFETAIEVTGLTPGDNIALLRATGNALTGLGWQAQPVPGDRPRITARRRGGETAAAKVRESSLVITARTPLVRPVEGDAGEVVGG